jgi:hypothetical protein
MTTPLQVECQGIVMMAIACRPKVAPSWCPLADPSQGITVMVMPSPRTAQLCGILDGRRLSDSAVLRRPRAWGKTEQCQNPPPRPSARSDEPNRLNFECVKCLARDRLNFEPIETLAGNERNFAPIGMASFDRTNFGPVDCQVNHRNVAAVEDPRISLDGTTR